MKRRDLIKLATAGTVGLMLPITVSAGPKDLNAEELQKEIDQQIQEWMPMVEKAELALPITPEFMVGNPEESDPAYNAFIGSCSYIASRAMPGVLEG